MSLNVLYVMSATLMIKIWSVSKAKSTLLFEEARLSISVHVRPSETNFIKSKSKSRLI